MSFVATYPFELPLLPPPVGLKNPLFFDGILKARTELAELNGYSLSLPNPLLLLSPAIVKESMASSEIENIHTTLVEAFQNQLFPEWEQREADKEVLRYREAVLWSFQQLQEIPISTRLILGIQEKLIPSSGGHYRKQQNKIENTTAKEVVYTPPIASQIPHLMSNWENFVNQEDDSIDPLIRCATAHYQFEAIHPFLDGNGRTGRILIVLQLVQNKILNLPVLYVSGFINKNRNKYYQLLRGVTREKDWNSFILFLLDAFYQQAKETKGLLLKLRMLYEGMREEIKAKLPKIYSGDLVEQLFSFPIITPVKLGDRLNIHYTTATRHLKALTQEGFLRNRKFGKYQFYINEKLMKVLE